MADVACMPWCAGIATALVVLTAAGAAVSDAPATTPAGGSVTSELVALEAAIVVRINEFVRLGASPGCG